MLVKVAPDKAGRLVRVSLRDVPLAKRRMYARHLLDAAARFGGYEGLAEARAITAAVLRPSARTYLIPEKDVVAMLGAVPNGQPRKFKRVEVDGRTLNVPDGWA
jgi:hypothetical protein